MLPADVKDSMSQPRKIEIWTFQSAEDTRSALPTLGKVRTEVTRVEISVLSKNLTEFLAGFQQLLEGTPAPKAGYYVDEIELNLGVNGSGGIALFGKIEAGVEAGIKVKLKKHKSGAENEAT